MDSRRDGRLKFAFVEKPIGSNDMNKHRGLELISILLICVGALAALWEPVGILGDRFGLVRFSYFGFDPGWPLIGFGLICLFLGFAGRALSDIEKNTRR